MNWIEKNWTSKIDQNLNFKFFELPIEHDLSKLENLSWVEKKSKGLIEST